MGTDFLPSPSFVVTTTRPRVKSTSVQRSAATSRGATPTRCTNTVSKRPLRFFLRSARSSGVLWACTRTIGRPQRSSNADATARRSAAHLGSLAPPLFAAARKCSKSARVISWGLFLVVDNNQLTAFLLAFASSLGNPCAARLRT
ncbi:hypothetical protein L6R52_25485 [Myxococcota bacterium]|nr:hypothetical protein [Myxococcota bacterium]